MSTSPSVRGLRHDGIRSQAQFSALLLRAKPSKDGDAEPRGYGGITALLAWPPAMHAGGRFCFLERSIGL